jgi:hypothetical protein
MAHMKFSFFVFLKIIGSPPWVNLIYEYYIMLIVSMSNNSKINSISLFMIFLAIFSQTALGISENKASRDSEICDWQQTNIFFMTHGWSEDVTSNNNSIVSTSFQLCSQLHFHYHICLWPFYSTFTVWNQTGIVNSFKVDHCACTISNFTGTLIHRPSLLGHYWYIIGYCTELKIRTSY